MVKLLAAVAFGVAIGAAVQSMRTPPSSLKIVPIQSVCGSDLFTRSGI